MMKKNLFKGFIILVMMLLVTTACNSRKDGGKSQKEQANTKDSVYGSEKIALDGVKGEVTAIYVRDDKIYFSTYEEVKEIENEEADITSVEEIEEEFTLQDGAGGNKEETIQEEVFAKSEPDVYRMYYIKKGGSDVKEISLIERKENEQIASVLVDQKNNIIYMLDSYNNENDQTSCIIVKTDQQGKELNRKDITKDIKADTEIDSSNLFFDNEGRMILVLNQEVCVFDGNYNLLFRLEVDENTNNAALTKVGHFIVGGDNDRGAYVRELDIENKNWGKEIQLGIEYFNSTEALLNGMDYDFYYQDDFGIYGYDMTDEKSTMLIDFVASDIDSDAASGIVPIGEEQFIGITNSGEDGISVIKYKKADSVASANKKIITYGALELNDDVKDAAMQFNRQNNEYRIEFKDYSSEEDPETKMNMDIIAGNVPDIIDLSGMPIEQYISKGMLEDLTPYFEKDPELKETDIVDSVLNAMKLDGKLYYTASGFSVSTMIAGSQDVGKETGWTFADMKQLLEARGEETRPFYIAEKINTLYILLKNSTSDFIDRSTGECDFDSNAFKEVLEFCNACREMQTDYGSDYPDLIKEGKVLFEEGEVSLGDIQAYRKLYGGDITLIGYPNREKEGSYFNLVNTAGIYSKSENKKGAWEFIRILMSAEYQKNVQSDMPTRKDCFEIKIKERTTTKAYVDEFGNRIEPVYMCWGYYNYQMDLEPASDEEVEIYRELVDSTKRVEEYNDFILDIILEEAEAYFNGEESLDKAAEVIQSRVKTYINENR